MNYCQYCGKETNTFNMSRGYYSCFTCISKNVPFSSRPTIKALHNKMLKLIKKEKKIYLKYFFFLNGKKSYLRREDLKTKEKIEYNLIELQNEIKGLQRLLRFKKGRSV